MSKSVRVNLSIEIPVAEFPRELEAELEPYHYKPLEENTTLNVYYIPRSDLHKFSPELREHLEKLFFLADALIGEKQSYIIISTY